MKAKLNVVEKPLEWLQPAEYNPRTDLQPGDPEYEKIKRSIESFSYVDPIIANADGTIIGGHQRYKVLQDLGYSTADVVVVDKTKDEEKALNIALNKIGGAWDEEKLCSLLIELNMSDIDVQLTGFEQKELDNLVLNYAEPEPQDDDFDEEEAEEEARKNTRSYPGCVWRLGDHRLMCGDSTDEDDVSCLLDGATVDLVITDPPYNVAYGDKNRFLNEHYNQKGGRHEENIENDVLSDNEFYDFLRQTYANAKRAMKPGAAIYTFHSDSHGLIFRQVYKDVGLNLTQCLIWEKNNFVIGRSDYQWRHEPILYGWKEGAPHYFTDDRSQDTIFLDEDVDLDSMKKPDLIAYIKDMRKAWAEKTTVIYENMPRKNDLHPTMKPISLIGRLMRNSSRKGWSVLDPFGGSGSTLMAAEQLGRRAYTMEVDEVFCDVIVKRWEEYTGKTAVLEE